MSKRILFIISDTGGGHRSAANAVIDALTSTGGDFTCEMVDLLRVSGLPGIRNAPELYAFFSSGHIWLHNLLFRLSNHPRIMDVLSSLLYRIARERIRKVIDAFGPELVVVIHPLAVRPMCAYRDETGAAWPVVTIVTDLVSVHASWLSPRADLYLLPTREALTIAERQGVPGRKARCVGFPVHPRFCGRQPDRQTVRSQLGLEAERFTLLITSGGAGGGQIDTLVKKMESQFPQFALLVVTGRNQLLREKLTDRQPRPIHTHVYGFVNNMEQLMTACDAVITKAGPGTIMEAAALGRPLILTGAVGLQEEGNIHFVQNAGIGVHCDNPEAIVRYVSRLAGENPPPPLPPVSSYAGTRTIAEIIGHMLESKGDVPSCQPFPATSSRNQ